MAEFSPEGVSGNVQPEEERGFGEESGVRTLKFEWTCREYAMSAPES